MALQLALVKPGDVVPKLHLSLNKGATFRIKLSWDTDYDLDAHALLAVNDGNGAKVSSLLQVLSTYNMKKTNPAGALSPNPNGSFSTPEGALTHSGDARTGVGADVDEMITVDGSKVPAGVNEIPIFVTIHPKNHPATFAEVKDAKIVIEDEAGKVLGSYNLSGEFGKFNAVQMGSLMHSDAGWEYGAAGVGFVGDFNTVLESFS